MTECKFDNEAYPNLCMAHFAIDGKDHSGCLCDEGVAALVTLSIQEKLEGVAKERERCAKLQEQYNEVILAVERKWEGETRHQTALRYIKECERVGREAAAALAAQKPQ